ncbi:2Fe-2S iron-sulfur cluster binding domain-containing protein [Candidatus Woesearchaeota archaeon]|nr:2Fe-2S iron-sulfur cluster binding domain-containing protein [Candidatus Woesearchaeota archaeon]
MKDNEKITIEIVLQNPEEDKEPQVERFSVPFEKGMRVLDAVIYVQENFRPDLAYRWNCGEGICGSCAAEVNDRAVLMCKHEMTPDMKIVRIAPMNVFPVIKDLVVDISEVYKKVLSFKPHFISPQKATREFWTMHEEQTKEAASLRTCIDCMICYDTCHVLRNHENKNFIGPRNIVKLIGIDKHPKNTFEHAPLLEKGDIWSCNVTRCCTASCPQNIKITEDSIIYAKERIMSEKMWKPIKLLFSKDKK